MRALGTALVVHSDTAAMIEGSPRRLLYWEFAESGDDYQSGPERPHSKGCRQFIMSWDPRLNSKPHQRASVVIGRGQ
jgi:hypothetical protein